MSTKLVHTTVGPLKSGDTLLHTLPVLDDSDVAVNLTGATVLYQVVKTLGATPVVNLSSVDSPATIVLSNNTDSPPVLNTITVTIDKALIQPLRGTYHWECEVTDLLGQRQTVGFGNIVFKRDIINP